MKKIIILFTLIISVNVGKSNVDEKSTSSLNNEITLEMESPLLLENWMLNDSIWNVYNVNENNFEVVQDTQLIVEDWMLNNLGNWYNWLT